MLYVRPSPAALEVAVSRVTVQRAAVPHDAHEQRSDLLKNHSDRKKRSLEQRGGSFMGNFQ